MTGPAPTKRTRMTRAQLTIYALMHGPGGWLVRLAEGWRLCGDAPWPDGVRPGHIAFKWLVLLARGWELRDTQEPEAVRGWSIAMWRWEPL